MKTFERGRFVTAESDLQLTTITEHVDQSILDKVYSVMSSITALSTSKMFGVINTSFTGNFLNLVLRRGRFRPRFVLLIAFFSH